MDLRKVSVANPFASQRKKIARPAPGLGAAVPLWPARGIPSSDFDSDPTIWTQIQCSLGVTWVSPLEDSTSADDVVKRKARDALIVL
jgi:hypothetical protein